MHAFLASVVSDGVYHPGSRSVTIGHTTSGSSINQSCLSLGRVGSVRFDKVEGVIVMSSHVMLMLMNFVLMWMTSMWRWTISMSRRRSFTSSSSSSVPSAPSAPSQSVPSPS
mmetsp:Transcript_39669/g.45325  ORF Transcript_39669/g.45325 Transcript_39669/m.45325 type:complete len:112 (+) Transcript_39669:688-1023(+)